MAYNPGITNRSGEILAQATASAAQTRMQGYQNATNSLLKGFSDLTKKQQEDELQIRDANSRLSSDPELERKIRASGNTKLIASLDKLQTPETGMMNKFFGSGKGSAAKDLVEYGKATDTMETRDALRAQRLALKAAEKRIEKTEAQDDKLNAIYGERFRVPRALENDSLQPGVPDNVANFTTPFNPLSKVPPMVREMSVFQGNPEHYSTSPATPLYKDPRVSGFLKDQSEMLRNSNNTASPILPDPRVSDFLANQASMWRNNTTPISLDNSFMQSPKANPMGMGNLAQTLPAFDRNNGGQVDPRVTRALGGSQVVAAKPVDDSPIAQFFRAGGTLTNAGFLPALLEQNKQKLTAEGNAIERELAFIKAENARLLQEQATQRYNVAQGFLTRGEARAEASQTIEQRKEADRIAALDKTTPDKVVEGTVGGTMDRAQKSIYDRAVEVPQAKRMYEQYRKANPREKAQMLERIKANNYGEIYGEDVMKAILDGSAFF